MSKTYKDKLKRIQKQYYKHRDAYLLLSELDKAKVDHWYRQTPSWWNLMFHTTKRRRQERDLLRKINIATKGYSLLWPIDKKPHVYYY